MDLPTFTLSRATAALALLAGCTLDEPAFEQAEQAELTAVPPPTLTETTANIVSSVVGDPVVAGRWR